MDNKKVPISKYVDKIMLYSQWFDMFKMAKDTENMLVVLYQMRLIHGLMIAETTKTIHGLEGSTLDTKDSKKKLYDISINDGIISSVREMIADSEDVFKNYVIEKKFADISRKFPSSDKLDVAKGIYPGREWLKKFDAEQSNIDIKDVFCCDSYDIKYPSIVLFYTNWCKISRNFLPIWNKFRDSCKGKKINLIKVNCEGKGKFCKKFNIQGYPTVMLFNDGIKEEFMGKRSVKDLQDYVKGKTGVTF